MERGGWWTTVQGVAKSQTQPSQSTAAAAAFMIVKKVETSRCPSADEG